MADLLRQIEENGHRLRSRRNRHRPAAHRPGAAHRRARAAHDAAAAAAPVGASAGRPTPRRCAGRAKPSRAAEDRLDAAQARADAADGRSAGRRSRRGRLQRRASICGKPASTTRRSHRFARSPRPIPSTAASSYANNLIGRALLDKGDARAAAEALLANYRDNPGGRARARQPVLPRPGADEARPAGPGVQGLLASSTPSMEPRSGPTSRSSKPTPRRRPTAANLLLRGGIAEARSLSSVRKLAAMLRVAVAARVRRRGSIRRARAGGRRGDGEAA